MARGEVNLWTEEAHARRYLDAADAIPHRREGEEALFERFPPRPRRIVDLGSGAGRLLELARARFPAAEYLALDFSPTMLAELRGRYAGDPRIRVIEHDLSLPLLDLGPDLGEVDAVISCFAIHHVSHARKRALYAEIFAALAPGGTFRNLEHVTSPTPGLHQQFLEALDITPDQEDPSNRLLDLETQLGWLREIGYADVDCLWKWRELALMVGRKPPAS